MAAMMTNVRGTANLSRICLETDARTRNPGSSMDNRMSSICVFCGSSPGARPEYGAAARQLGGLIGERGFALVFGGGNVGLMGEVARAAHHAGAPIVGVLPEFLRHLEQPLKAAEELI